LRVYNFILIILLVVFVLPHANGYTQESTEYADFVLNKDKPGTYKYQPRKVTYLFANRKSAIVKYNPISLTFGGLLLFYQKVISQQLASHCPYEISCSEFSRLCIQEYGLFKGVALSADRLTRCTDFSRVDMNRLWFNESMQIIDPIERYKHHKRHKH